MIPAQTSERLGQKTKLLVITNNGLIEHTTVQSLEDHFDRDDVLIVNRSGTLPSSFRGRLQRTGEFIEIRLAAFQGPDPRSLETWLAISFGAGDWSIPTENRQSPPQVQRGDFVTFGPDLRLKVLDCLEDRLLQVEFLSSDLEKNLYRYGRPIQYSYLRESLEVWDQQTIFSGPPISVEPPSASFPLTWELLFSLKRKGVHIIDVLHGAGISSTGSSELDQRLPLAEWYDIPPNTAERFEQAKRHNKKIVAVGTTVLRALESAWNGKGLNVGQGLTCLKIESGQKIQTANGLITGLHEVGTSHMNILDSFCSQDNIRGAYAQAEQLGYRSHEFGDLALLQVRERRG